MPRIPTRFSQGVLYLQDIMSMFTAGSLDARSIRDTEEEVLSDMLPVVVEYLPTLSVRGFSEVHRLLDSHSITPIQRYACTQLQSLLFLLYVAPSYMALAEGGDVTSPQIARLNNMGSLGVTVDNFQDMVTQVLVNYAATDWGLYSRVCHLPEYQLASRMCNTFEWSVATLYGDWVWPFFLRNGSDSHMAMLQQRYPDYWDSSESFEE